MKPVESFGVQDVEMILKHKTLKFHIDGRKFDPALMNPSHPIYMFTKEMTRNQKYIQAYCDMFTQYPITPGIDVIEFCAGIGVLAEALYDILKPRYWAGIELDQSCVDNWISKRAYVIKGDMYDPHHLEDISNWDSTMVICEWPTNTLRKFWSEPQVQVWAQRLFNKRPRYVVFTDIETGWIHMPNHYPHYADLFRRLPDYDDSKQSAATLRRWYQEIYKAYMLDKYGYRCVAHTNGGGGDYFLLEEA